MLKTIRIRHVSEQAHRRLEVLAATAGMSSSDYLRVELERMASQLTTEELTDRLRALEPVTLDESAADAVRAERASRG